MCLECSGEHRGLAVHISFVRSVTMDPWSEIQLKKMEAGGNDRLNRFLAARGVPKETDIPAKYNSAAASVCRNRIQALADGRPWRDPPVVKEIVAKKPPLSGGGGGFKSSSSADVRRNQSVGDFRSGGGGGVPARSRSTEYIYTRAELEASTANKGSFFATKMVENESRPEGVPPSQGGKYVGFGSSPTLVPRNNSQGDVVSVATQGFGRLSMVAASAAQSAAVVVQAGTKEFSS
ncbi:ARF-GAP domain 6 [Actinidia rufa]|uniref:ARF-GAP domain 6 n=1 Tax=Actinidia rufa TaxID=165716 RepID=A0A7J0E8Y0_9ERIC|nr:ARF-GAP domain 6 [Actinidia rufa]